jgi:uncharacterized protein (TIGR00251 family)
MTWMLVDGKGVTLRLHVQPGAKKTEVVGLHGEALKIRLAAPPVDGKANACLIAFLADALGIARAAIRLVSGETSRAKKVRIDGIDPESARRALRAPDQSCREAAAKAH